MSGLSDEEILRRLSEIEGRCTHPRSEQLDPRFPARTCLDCGYFDTDWWNPLDNDSQAFALIAKHRLTVAPQEPITGVFGCEHWSVTGKATARDESLNRAICLAIIEAHQ